MSISSRRTRTSTARGWMQSVPNAVAGTLVLAALLPAHIARATAMGPQDVPVCELISNPGDSARMIVAASAVALGTAPASDPRGRDLSDPAPSLRAELASTTDPLTPASPPSSMPTSVKILVVAVAVGVLLFLVVGGMLH